MPHPQGATRYCKYQHKKVEYVADIHRRCMLSNVMSEFARTMVTDFPIEGMLDHLVKRIAEVLPITAAGVTLLSPESGPRYVAAPNNSPCARRSCSPSTAKVPAWPPIARAETAYNPRLN